jgi:acetolactate synthase-1/3 small subunit
VVSLLRGRCFAVVSFTAAKSHRPGIAHLTIVVDTARTKAGRVAARLAKLADVWNVRELESMHSLVRELALLRVQCPPDLQQIVAEATSRDGLRVIHRDGSSMILEIVAEPETLDAILGNLQVPVVEIMRSGALAMAFPSLPRIEG